MGKETIADKIKRVIAGISFKVFLWAIGMTSEQYWYQIYVAESKERG